jgi:hypothetical protein
MNQSVHIHLDGTEQFECRHAVTERRPHGYPILDISTHWTTGGGGALLYFTPEGLRQLHAAVGAYLMAHAILDSVPVPAEACTDIPADWSDLDPAVERDGQVVS